MAENELVDVLIPEGVTELTEDTIANHRNVASVVIPEGVLVIGDNAFSGCVNLKQVKIPDSVMAIGKYAFSNCDSLQSVEIPDGIKVIEEGVFANCTELESIIIPETVTSIKSKAFAACTGVKHIEIPDNLTSCASDAFPNSQKYLCVNKNYRYENGMMINSLNEMLLFYNGGEGEVAVPDSVKGIAYRAFCGSNASVIRLSDSVRSISDEAFINCANQVSVLISESVDYIESSAFDGNTKICCVKGSYAENFCRENNFAQKPDEVL